MGLKVDRPTSSAPGRGGGDEADGDGDDEVDEGEDGGQVLGHVAGIVMEDSINPRKIPGTASAGSEAMVEGAAPVPESRPVKA